MSWHLLVLALLPAFTAQAQSNALPMPLESEDPEKPLQIVADMTWTGPEIQIQSKDMRGLGTLLEPQSFPALVQRLHAVILDPDDSRIAFRTVKSSVVSFPLSQAVVLEPSLKFTLRPLATKLKFATGGTLLPPPQPLLDGLATQVRKLRNSVS